MKKAIKNVSIIIEVQDDDTKPAGVIYSLINFDKKCQNIIDIEGMQIDSVRHCVTVNCKEIRLTSLEFALLLFLASQPRRVFTYQQIYEGVWGEPYAYEKNNIMTHISHLRAKIEPNPAHPRYIENVRGVGYRFKKQ